jgi:hypothetical protein
LLVQDDASRRAMKILCNPRLYSALFLKILNKDGKLVPFVWNRCQRIIYEHMLWAQRNGLPQFFLILKPRQIGSTTLAEALGFHATATVPGFRARTLAHDKETTREIFEKCHVFYENLPLWMRPELATNNISRLVYPALKSRYMIGTAGTKAGAGVGRTINFVHCSEVGKYPEGGYELISALEECVPINNGIAIYESTAYTTDGWFFEMWDKSRNNVELIRAWIRDGRKGRLLLPSNYIPIFIPWYKDDGYVMHLEPGEVIKYTSEEKQIVKQFNLTPEQIKWRRYKMLGNHKFHQWYPITPEECWGQAEGLVFAHDIKPIHRIATFPVNRDDYFIVGGVDWGSDHPFAYMRVAINKKTQKAYVFSEYKARGMLTHQQAATIKADYGKADEPHILFADKQGRQNRLDILSYGVVTYPANKDVEGSIDLIKTLLSPHPETGEPMLYFMDNVPETIRQLFAYARKRVGLEELGDIIKKDDDLVDTLRYILYSVWSEMRRRGKENNMWCYGAMADQ